MDEHKRELKDSGKRQEFASGAVRDVQEGKGRYDLMPMDTMYKLITNPGLISFPNAADAPSCVKRAILLTIEAMVNPNVAENFALRAAGEMLCYMEILYREGKDAPQVWPLPGIPTHGLFRVARIYEKGAIKYAPRNWEKGINLARFLDSALRHEFQTAEGKADEDHPAQAAWNLMSFCETKNWIDTGVLPITLDDLPKRLIPRTQDNEALREAMKNPGTAEAAKVFTVTTGWVPIPGKPGVYRMPDGSEVTVTM